MSWQAKADTYAPTPGAYELCAQMSATLQIVVVEQPDKETFQLVMRDVTTGNVKSCVQGDYEDIARYVSFLLRNYDEGNPLIESRSALSRLYQDFVLGL